MPPRLSFAEKVFRDATDDARRMHDIAMEQSKHTREHMHEVAKRRASSGGVDRAMTTPIEKRRIMTQPSAGETRIPVSTMSTGADGDLLRVKSEDAGTGAPATSQTSADLFRASSLDTRCPPGSPTAPTLPFQPKFGPQYACVPLGQGPSFANAHQQVRLAHQVHALTQRPAQEEFVSIQGLYPVVPTPNRKFLRAPGRLFLKRTRDGISYTTPYKASAPRPSQPVQQPLHPYRVVEDLGQGMEQEQHNPYVDNNVPLRAATYPHATGVAAAASTPEVRFIMGTDAKQTHRVFSAPAPNLQHLARPGSATPAAMDGVEGETRKRTFVPNPEARISYGPTPSALTHSQVVQMMGEQACAAAHPGLIPRLPSPGQPRDPHNPVWASDFHGSSVGTVRHPSGALVYAYEAPPVPAGTLMMLADTALHKFTEPGAPPPVNNDVPARLAENLSSASCELAKCRLEMEKKRDLVRKRLQEGEKVKAKEREALEVLSQMRQECRSALNRGQRW